MFQKESIIKYYVFRGIDVLALILALVLSNFLRFWEVQLFAYDHLYINIFAVSVIVCIASNIIFKLDRDIFDRGTYQEFLTVCKITFCIWSMIMGYLFMSQQGEHYSRLQSFYYIIIYFWASYTGRQIAKPLIAGYYRKSRSCKKIMLVTSSDKAEGILEKFGQTNNWYFEIHCITIVDKDMTGRQIRGIPVVAKEETMLEQAKSIVLDGVFINVSYKTSAVFDIQKALHDFQQMGVIVHINIDALELDVTDKVIESLGLFKVVSYASRLYEPGQMMLKRCMDILGSIIGIILTFIIGIFVVPAICIESPGNPIYAQLRVGKNGRRFKMYKFRSMYPDADRRKAELMARNDMQGAMF